MTDPSYVRLELESRAETLTLVRGMLAGLAEPLSMDPELLDDLKTAVSEACNNVVVHAYPGGSGPLTVILGLGVSGVEVLVRDRGRGMPKLVSDDTTHGVGVPVIRALSRSAKFIDAAGGGTEVWMEFPADRDSTPLFERPADATPEDGWADNLSGDAVVSVSPVALLAGVLGRISRALAASARFSLDRFSDVYLVTDAIAAHAATAAADGRVGFAISAGSRRLELMIGPFRVGSVATLRGDSGGSDSPLTLLTDEIDARCVSGRELLRVLMIDHRDAAE